MLTAYIFNDNTHLTRLLSEFILRIDGLQLIGTTFDPFRAINFITSERKTDITFIDTDINRISGIGFSKLVNLHTNVIFTTSLREIDAEAFEEDGSEYLVKPINYPDFLTSINKFRDIKLQKALQNSSENDYFFIKSEIKGKLIRINFSDILYIEGAHNYINIHQKGEITSAYLTLKEIEDSLPVPAFIRVHKSFIINTRKILSVENNLIILEDGTPITLGNVYKDVFFDALNSKILQSQRSLNR